MKKAKIVSLRARLAFPLIVSSLLASACLASPGSGALVSADAPLPFLRQAPAAQRARPVVLDFYASWCTPCKMLKKLIDQARKKYGDEVDFVAVDIDDPENRALVQRFKVQVVPTVVFIKEDGQISGITFGYSPDDFHWGLKQVRR